ncbi:ATP-dependent RecD-like DNA helicase [Myxococcota bacterium]|nr:ATP-dependent RecD-like DNA helicase [Myxococcota bacterium]MBU1380045.1 ATP-dependent RecD-like DNA helicase [Myxococcota bacterium]MBU1495503.1 ATP-dependent RecD-like DNA helicase [Myxococcota bacterium]
MDNFFRTGKLEIPDPSLAGRTEIFNCEIITITFHSSDSGFTVLKARREGEDNILTCVGMIGDLAPGTWLKTEGTWEINGKFGPQFRITRWEMTQPATKEGLIRFLGSGLVNGIGISFAERIVNHFGADTLSIIENKPHKLMEVEGIGKVRCESISRSFLERKHMAQVMVWLQSYGVGLGTSLKIYSKYKDKTIEVVKENPYRLADEIWGIGFHTADRIARTMGFDSNSPFRLEAAVLYILKESENAGHVFLPKTDVLEKASLYLEIPDLDIDAILERLVFRNNIVIENDDVYLKRFHIYETFLAKELGDLLNTPKSGINPDREDIRQLVDEKMDMVFDETQITAVKTALGGGVTVITGGPGTGKTTLVRAICEIVMNEGFRIMLAAPTGRAAKRLSEASGLEAKTIHRLLEFQPRLRTWGKNHENQLETDYLIIDEVSMVDLALMYHLIRALPSSAGLILVGDHDQLPSVGAGTVLEDLIECGEICVVRLNTIYRQAEESFIVKCAHNINNGLDLITGKGGNGDLFFIEKEDPQDVIRIINELVTKRIPDSYAFDPFSEVQVLTPMHRGVLGTENLNLILQKNLNSSSDQIKFNNYIWHTGDRVIQLRNNYDLGVFNGDIGRIVSIDRENTSINVQFDERIIEVQRSDMGDLSLAYAISIHKSQGSEYSAVIIPVHTQHTIMLQRNLIYTAVTRAKKLVVMVGTKKAMRMAISNFARTKRYSKLAEKIQKYIKSN